MNDPQGVSVILQDAIVEMMEMNPPDGLQYLTDILGERCGKRTNYQAALRRITATDVRSARMQDNLSESFLLLTSMGKDNNLSETIPLDDFNHFLKDACTITLSDNVANVVLPMLCMTPDIQTRVSYNDYMCVMNVVVLLIEISRAADELFQSLDQESSGCIDTKTAIQNLNQFQWIFPTTRRHQDKIRLIDTTLNGTDQMGFSVTPITEVLPSHETHLQRAESYIRQQQAETDTKISRELFIDTVLLHLSPLSYYSQTWTT